MTEKTVHPQEELFYPKNIAVVGALPRGGLAGGGWGGNTYS
jgi:acyl-CoA synthetase (NDP forming)